MRTCPHCKGKRYFPKPKAGEISMLPPENPDQPVQYEEVPCSTCEATGKVTELAYAIYVGRGGPAPSPERQGYA